MLRTALHTVAVGAGLAVVALGTGLTLPGAASAAPAGYATTTDPVAAAAGWLSTQFEDAQHVPTPAGDRFDFAYGDPVVHYTNYGQNADAIFGLAAAGSAGSKIAVAYRYLADNVDAYADFTDSDGYGTSDGAIGKTALAAEVVGADPDAVGGRDLLGKLADDECPPGSSTCTPGAAANLYTSISESFVLLAEARAGGTHAPSAAAQTYFASLQCASGGFTGDPTACGSGAADVDATSYALMALRALPGDHAKQSTAAVGWLRAQQHDGGYWISQGAANTNSTGLAAAALAGAGVDVTSARSWLLSQQVPAGTVGAGALKYLGAVDPTDGATTAGTSPAVLATAQGLTGLATGGTLATVSAHDASAGIRLFAPTVALSSSSVRAGKHQTATGTGFAAGESVRVTLDGHVVGTVVADALGSVHLRYQVPSSTDPGTAQVLLSGVTSALSAAHRVTVLPGASASGSSPGSSSGSSSSGSASTSSAPAGDTSSGSGDSGTSSSTSASSTGDSSTGGSSSASATSAPAAAQALAATGQDGPLLAAVGALGGLAVLGGAALCLVGRRRSH